MISSIFIPFKLIRYLLKLVGKMGVFTRNSLGMILMILLSDHLHLQNQILKSKYKLIYGKNYVALHNRISDTVSRSTRFAINQ